MRKTAVGVLVVICVAFAQQTNSSKSSQRLPLPPFSNGGIRGLWAHDHEYIQNKFGEFQLLDYSKINFEIKREGVTDTTWKLVTMGNYLPEGVQFATLARLKNRSGGLLLIMFDWVSLEEAKQRPGVFYTSFIGKEKLLLRTRQSRAKNGIDTLFLSCANTESLCGKAFYDRASKQIVYRVVGQDPAPSLNDPQKTPRSNPDSATSPSGTSSDSGTADSQSHDDNPWE